MPPIVVTTQHNDNLRTGANLQEEVLNIHNVNPQQFGKLFVRPVDGQIYAQPLYLPNLNIPGKGIHNVVYVATMHNTVYAFDADDPAASTPLWSHQLGPSVRLPDPNIGPGGYKDISREVGILSTPVISLDHNAIYVVAFSKEGSSYSHRLHALDLLTGEERFGGPVVIGSSVPGGTVAGPSVPGTGAGSGGGRVTFTSNRQIQRSALLLVNDVIFLAFAAYGDQGPYHGWLLSYNAATLQRLQVYNTTPNGNEGGIWQAGQGPSADDSFIYVMTGNGTFTPDAKALSCSIIKLRHDLTISDWFAPHNVQALTGPADQDLGSAGALLIPATNLLIGGGKESRFYVIQRDRLGHFNAANDNQIVQTFFVNQDTGATHHIHGGPVYWSGPNGPSIFVWTENDNLRAYRMEGGKFQTTPISKGSAFSPGMPGGILSVSANGDIAGTGIVWASHPLSNANQAVAAGMLHAYNASDLTNELWNSKQNVNRDDVGTFAKFCPPTIANGKVYMASFSGYLAAYGLLPYRKVVLQDAAIGTPALMNMNDADLALAWTGTDGAHRLNVAISGDGQIFDRKVTLPESSPDGPGFAFGNGLSFLAWTGTDGAHPLNVAISGDGQIFDRKVTLPESSPHGPALAFGNGLLYLAWAGNDARLNVMSSADGVAFTHKVTLGDTSSTAPALSFINGKLYLLWCGTGANSNLNILESSDGMTFTNKVTLSESSDAHPALVAQSGLLLAWAGRNSARLLNLLAGGDIHSLSNKLTYMYGESCAAGPALATFKGKVYVGWTSTDSAHSINVGVLS